MAEAIDTGCRWQVMGHWWLLALISDLCVGVLYKTQSILVKYKEKM